ncbi:MAG TPA: DUF4147 domain-containing protein [Gammaproteobacteria bacterium]|nr:DUF4147 domain-containing protein [Gammaproteobacteria bacterium]
MGARDLAESLYRAALAAADGRQRTVEWLRRHPMEGPVWAVAVGKAAAAMAEGAREALGSRLRRGLLVTKHGHLGPDASAYAPFECYQTGHPVPDAASLAAGRRLLECVAEAPPAVHWLFLVSGGASSLVEALPAGHILQDLQDAQQWLLGSGLAIAEMNRVRKGLSLLKGGRLAARLTGQSVTALMLSDVPGDDPSVIGSGLLAAAAGDRDLSGLALPEWLRKRLEGMPAAPVPDHPALARVRHHVIASLGDACRGAVQRARELGLDAVCHRTRLAGDAAAAGHRLGALARQASPGVQVWGGETTVVLPAAPGRGGRCQQLALAASLELQGIPDTCLLAAGTDGTDGPTEDAGAIVDGDTVERGRRSGMSVESCLERADAGSFLAASGDLLHTGPTGTNVNDLVLAVKAPG